MDSPQISGVGFPARFAAVRTATNTVLTHTITADIHPNHCYVLQGVDCSVQGTAVTLDAWISLGSPGTKMVFWSTTTDPLSIPAVAYATGMWRGYLPFYLGETLEVGLECGLPSNIAIHAWGVWMPTPLVVNL